MLNRCNPETTPSSLTTFGNENIFAKESKPTQGKAPAPRIHGKFPDSSISEI